MYNVSLNPLKHTVKMQDRFAWAWDCETKDGLNGSQLFCWSLCCRLEDKFHKEKLFSGSTIPEFISILKELNNTKYKQFIYVHNLDFDVRFLIDFCIRENIQYNNFQASSKTLFFELKELNFRFVDSFQFLLCSQDSAEITFKIPEQLRKIDCQAIFEKEFGLWSNDEKIHVLEHNRNDVRALYRIMNDLRKELFEIANVDLLSVNTPASLAMKAFRKKMKDKIENCYLKTNCAENKKIHYEFDKAMNDFARSAYFGGRTECFSHELCVDGFYIDKVSMFPFVMHDREYPAGKPYWVKGQAPIEMVLEEGLLCIVECKVLPNYNEKYPVLPMKVEEKTLFANKSVVGVWNSVEIEYAYQRGYRFEFYRALVFPEKFNPFAEYIDCFFAIKKKEKGGKRELAKLLLNSLYGKFGQRSELEHIETKFFQDESEATNFYLEKIDSEIKAELKFNAFYGKWECKFTEKSHSVKAFQIIHLASFITSYARLELLKTIHECEEKKIKVYYSDTDSLVLDSIKGIETGSKLGQWKLEENCFDFQAFAPKSYFMILEQERFETMVVEREKILKCKGIPKCIRQRISEEANSVSEMRTLLNAEIVFDSRYLPLRASLVRNHSVLSYAVCKKKLSLIDSKRETLEDLSTIPLRD